MAIIPNNVFERNQVAGGRQAVEQTQLRTNAARANTPAQADIAARGNRPPPTPGFLVDGITNQTNQMPANFGNSGSQGYGVGAVLNPPTGSPSYPPQPGGREPNLNVGRSNPGFDTSFGGIDFSREFTLGAGPSTSNAPAPPSTVGDTGLNPTRRGVSPALGGRSPAPAPQSNPGALEGRGAATVVNPPASGGPGVGVGANNPTTVNDNALQGAVQAGGSATDMGYWAREGGPRNYVPGTQAAGSNLSIMGTGNPPGMPAPGTPIVPTGGGGYTAGGMQFTRDPSGDRAPGAGMGAGINVGGSGPGGAYQPGVDPMYMDPNRGPQTQPLVMGQGGGAGAGVGGLDGAIDAYLSASPGGGSEGSRRRQQLRNVMEALAGREDTNTRAGATIESANIGANADLTTTGMTQSGLDRRSQEDNAIRWDAANRGWTEIEQGMQGDPMEQIRLGMARELAEAGDRQGLFALLAGQQPQAAEPLMMDGVSSFAGFTNPDGTIRPPTMEELLSMQQIGALSPSQEQRLLQNGGR